MKLLLFVFACVFAGSTFAQSKILHEGLDERHVTMGDLGYDDKRYSIITSCHANRAGMNFTTQYINTAGDKKERTTFKWNEVTGVSVTHLGRVLLTGPSEYFENDKFIKRYEKDYHYLKVKEGFDAREIAAEMVRLSNLYRSEDDEQLPDTVEQVRDRFETLEELEEVSKPLKYNPSVFKKEEEAAPVTKTNSQADAIAAGAAGTLTAVDELTNSLDPEGNTRYAQIFSGFDGLSGDYKKLNANYKSKPFNATLFGFRMSALFLALEMRVGYNQSPYYEFEVENDQRAGSYVVDRVGIQRQTIALGVSGGLNFRIKRFCIYGLYGIDYSSVTTSKTMNPESKYTFDGDDIRFPDLSFVLSGGLDFNIPGTNMGLGVRYNLNNIKTSPVDNYVKINNNSGSRYQYYLNKISPEKLTWSDFGVRLIWSFE